LRAYDNDFPSDRPFPTKYNVENEGEYSYGE
jgi:hypothetical protein